MYPIPAVAAATRGRRGSTADFCTSDSLPKKYRNLDSMRVDFRIVSVGFSWMIFPLFSTDPEVRGSPEEYQCTPFVFQSFEEYRILNLITSVLETRQDAALKSFFRAVDSAVQIAEGRRRRLAESLEFLPLEIFVALPPGFPHVAM